MRRDFLESMVDRAASGRTVLLSSHQMSEIERVTDRLAIIHDGKVGLEGQLAELRDEIFEVTFSVADPLAELPVSVTPIEILSEQKSGRQVRWIIRGSASALESEVNDWPGAHSVRVRPATLEELFIACTRGARKREELV